MERFASGERRSALERMSDAAVDVLVVGGGVTGAGVALDAATRGLSVGLVEARDFAFGTSSRSSKMIHGGLRYLDSGDVGVVRESLAERRRLRENAPHLVRTTRWLLPMYGSRLSRQRARFGIGLWAYDRLGAARAGDPHRWLSRRETLDRAPNLESNGLVGALAYQDAAADDATLVMSVIRSAAAHGALIANGARVTSLVEHNGRVRGARVTTCEGDELHIRAGVVVVAAGIWSDTDELRPSDGHTFRIIHSKGVHLTIPAEAAGVDAVVWTYPLTGRNAFVSPWEDGLALVGTTDTPYDGDLSDPRGNEDDVGELLTTANGILETPIERGSVISVWAGLRPLVGPAGGDAGNTREVSRRHLTERRPGLVTLVGGKLTAYRAMAEDAVDAVLEDLGQTAGPCVTMDLALDGALDSYGSATVDRLCHGFGVDRPTARHLLRRYGSNAVAVLDAAGPAGLEPIHQTRPDLLAEAQWALEQQMALDVEAILQRRTRLALQLRPDELAAAAARVADHTGLPLRVG